MSGGLANENYKNLLHIRRRFLNSAAVRNAIAQVANAIFQTRLTHIWGEATTACASDSKSLEPGIRTSSPTGTRGTAGRA